MSIAASLCRPDSGGVWVDGIDMLTQPGRGRGRLGIAPQETGVYQTLSVRDNLRFFGELVGIRHTAITRRIGELADAFGLAHVLDQPARLLSAGQMRRLHVATAILRRPPLLLLDEPTSGVDPATRAHMLELVKALAGDGSAICYSTHYLTEAEELGASIAIIHQGSIVVRDSLEALIDSHGQSAVELHFDGPPPPLTDLGSAEMFGTTLRLRMNCDMNMAELLSSLGDSLQRLQTVRMIQPNLESAFRAVTEIATR
jgi:ABC-2 type transport system ATP-binding protein